MKISIIIPCKNESGVVENLLDSLVRQTRPADEVIVVDSNCTDDTIARAKTYTKKLPLKTAAATQAGPAHARNRGASKATGDMLISSWSLLNECLCASNATYAVADRLWLPVCHP